MIGGSSRFCVWYIDWDALTRTQSAQCSGPQQRVRVLWKDPNLTVDGPVKVTSQLSPVTLAKLTNLTVGKPGLWPITANHIHPTISNRPQ